MWLQKIWPSLWFTPLWKTMWSRTVLFEPLCIWIQLFTDQTWTTDTDGIKHVIALGNLSQDSTNTTEILCECRKHSGKASDRDLPIKLLNGRDWSFCWQKHTGSKRFFQACASWGRNWSWRWGWASQRHFVLEWLSFDQNMWNYPWDSYVTLSEKKRGLQLLVFWLLVGIISHIHVSSMCPSLREAFGLS